MEQMNERVQRGTDLLNAKFPIIWIVKVNPSRLDMGSNSDGLLEQLFPGLGYFRGLQQLGLGLGEGYEYGFDIEPDSDDDLEEWAQLTQAWREQLAR